MPKSDKDMHATRYLAQKPDAKVLSAEVSRVGEETFVFLTLNAASASQEIAEILRQAPLGLEMVSSTVGQAEKTVLVAKGNVTERAVLDVLQTNGESLSPPAPEKKAFNPWFWRGMTSIVGQSAQIGSSYLGTGVKSDRAALFGFASLNLTANIVNIIFGAQQKDDPHQLRLLKQQINTGVSQEIGQNIALPNIDQNPLDARKHLLPEKTFGQKFYDVCQQYSVSFGEIGLRLLGAVSLAFPITNWKATARHLGKGSFAKAWTVSKNANPVTFNAGLMTLIGKFTSLAAKEPDPYNPKGSSPLDGFREKIAFPASSVIEGAAAAWMTHDRLSKQKISIGGQVMPDYVGGFGNAVFVGGYGIRLAAPYGSLEVDMPQLYAHAADALQNVPEDKLAEQLGKVSVELAEHFQEKEIPVSTIYREIAELLARDHSKRIKAQPSLELKEVKEHERLSALAPTKQAAL